MTTSRRLCPPSRSMPAVQLSSTSASIIDVLDHVLDKGIVIDAWLRVSVVGIDLITVEGRMVVTSIETYVSAADPVAQINPAFKRPSQH
jgi:hypothetical protein